jgi:hypothetical protein
MPRKEEMKFSTERSVQITILNMGIMEIHEMRFKKKQKR